MIGFDASVGSDQLSCNHCPLDQPTVPRPIIGSNSYLYLRHLGCTSNCTTGVDNPQKSFYILIYSKYP